MAASQRVNGRGKKNTLKQKDLFGCLSYVLKKDAPLTA